MVQNVRLEPLQVSTNDGVSAKVHGIITYEIEDKEKAFLYSSKVHSSIKHLAEATLTTIFSSLNMKQMSAGLYTAQMTSLHGKEKISQEEESKNDFIHLATTAFLEEFVKTATNWGVKVYDLKIEKMEWNADYSDALDRKSVV